LVPKSVFDQSIFEGMKGDEDCPPVGVQSLRQDAGEKGFEVFELAIDGDSQGLKNAGGRVAFGPPAATRVKCFFDRFDQVGGCLNRLIGSAKHDRVGNGPAGGLFAELEKQIGQVPLVKLGKEIGRGDILRRVKSHVERSVGLEAESAAAIGQLIRRKPEIEQDAVDPLDAELIQDFRQLGIAGLFQDAARIVQDFGRLSEHHRVAIEADQFSGGT
jgi:hypothetical protein